MKTERKVAIIGTVGVPANYGGFETLVENIIGVNCSSDILYTIYCSSKNYPQKKQIYKKALLKYIPLEANGIQSILYDIISLFLASKHNDIILILGVSGCCILPIYRLFYSKKLIINIDGLEHKRDKWGKWTKKFLKFSEKMAIKYGNTIITDNAGIQKYVLNEYNKHSSLIAYGGNHVITKLADDYTQQILQQYNIKEIEYSFSVCRIEPENNIHLILEAFSRTKQSLVFVRNWGKSEYGKELLIKYQNYKNIKLLPPIYDLNILNVLRSNCHFYIHGHSAGGTNPSLVEAMFFKKPILAYNVIYNKETTNYQANYFSDVKELIELIEKPYSTYNNNAIAMFNIANSQYMWKIISQKYEALY